MRLVKTPTPLKIFLFICFSCAYKGRLISMYIPKNLVGMEKRTNEQEKSNFIDLYAREMSLHE